MVLKGTEFYNSEKGLHQYIESKNVADEANSTLEKPYIMNLAGDVLQKRILDLGCGDGELGNRFLENNSDGYYCGIDASKKMVEMAREKLPANATLKQCNIEDCWENEPWSSKAFDIVISSMALHYIHDLNKVMGKIHRVLKDEGTFIFSVEHPVITSNYESSEGNEDHGSWLVDNYFTEGERQTYWLGTNILKYHRSLETYFSLLINNGFLIDDVKEGKPVRERFMYEHNYEQRLKKPMYLIIKCKKKGGRAA
ncbi:class I SAM-dependent DNA methyltransferase [Virgibacillus xinjiangensis]|uniref:Class I SAM-dependent DNA methyltransferase n=1 Tax=Virgibacillus xinjiangensis TaxID=393090 RepID=A0ABV7CTX8_9BACI